MNILAGYAVVSKVTIFTKQCKHHPNIIRELMDRGGYTVVVVGGISSTTSTIMSASTTTTSSRGVCCCC